MKARLLLSAAAAVMALVTSAVLERASARELLTDDEMADARGGVLVAGDLAFQFGAIVKTFEDGVLSLQTQVTWTATGPQVEQVAGPGVTQFLDPALTALSASGEPLKSTDNTFVTQSGATILHDVAQGQLLNVLLNTQSDHQFRQDTDITLVLPGFTGMQADIANQITGMRLADDIRTAMSAGGH